MNLMQLRYVNRSIETLTKNDIYKTTTEKILQIRCLENIFQIGLHEPIYGEWQDVEIEGEA